MDTANSPIQRFRFGPFLLDVGGHKLKKNGIVIRLQKQPWQVLCALVEKPGDVVSREELCERLWPAGTFVDFEQSLNKAVNKVRQALHDSADHPVYVETLARHGYRFIAPIEVELPAEAARPPSTAIRKRLQLRQRRARPWLAAGAALILVVLGIGAWPLSVPQVEHVAQLTNDTKLKLGAIFSDGGRVLFGDGESIYWVPVSGGESKEVPLPFLESGGALLTGYSQVRQEILVERYIFSPSRETGALWLCGTDGQSPQRVGDEPYYSHFALSPDGQRIALSTEDGIFIRQIAGGERTKIHSMRREQMMAAENPIRVWWHPSGRRVGFLESQSELGKLQAWQVDDDGAHPRRIVPETKGPQGTGAWSLDGRRFFFTGGDGEISVRVEAGVFGWLRRAVVKHVTAGGQFRHPPAIDPTNPRRLYAVESVLRGRTVRYDGKAGRWVPFLGDWAGEMIDFSPDGKWMAYIPFPGVELHRCAADGSRDMVLSPGVEAKNPNWSPDGQRIAFAGRPAGTHGPLKLMLVSANGGDATTYRPEIQALSGYWSRDGKRLLVGQDVASPTGNWILHLDTGRLESVPGTEQLFSLRWSPGERRMVALDAALHPRVFDPLKQVWRRVLKDDIVVSWPMWSQRGDFIYGMAGGDNFRIEVSTGRVETIARIGGDVKQITNFGIGRYWGGWTRDWQALRNEDLSSTQIFRIDLDR